MKKSIIAVSLSLAVLTPVLLKTESTTVSATTEDTNSDSVKSLEIKDNMTISQIIQSLENSGLKFGDLYNWQIVDQLTKQGISIEGNRILGKPQGFTITLSKQQTGKDEDTTVIFGTGKPENLVGNNILKVNYSENGKEKSESINGKIFLIDEGSKFDSLKLKASNGNTYQVISTDKADVKVVSNTVDTSK